MTLLRLEPYVPWMHVLVAVVWLLGGKIDQALILSAILYWGTRIDGGAGDGG